MASLAQEAERRAILVTSRTTTINNPKAVLFRQRIGPSYFHLCMQRNVKTKDETSPFLLKQHPLHRETGGWAQSLKVGFLQEIVP